MDSGDVVVFALCTLGAAYLTAVASGRVSKLGLGRLETMALTAGATFAASRVLRRLT